MPVPDTTGLIDTGINLVPGAVVSVTATGSAIWFPYYPDGCIYTSNADGVISATHNYCGSIGTTHTADSSFLAPGLRYFSLIGVAGSGSYIQLGTSTTITHQSGTLFRLQRQRL